jgi:hypothetical protein
MHKQWHVINIENGSTWDQVGRQITNIALFVLGKEDFVCVARLSGNCISTYMLLKRWTKPQIGKLNHINRTKTIKTLKT